MLCGSQDERGVWRKNRYMYNYGWVLSLPTHLKLSQHCWSALLQHKTESLKKWSMMYVKYIGGDCRICFLYLKIGVTWACWDHNENEERERERLNTKGWRIWAQAFSDWRRVSRKSVKVGNKGVTKRWDLMSNASQETWWNKDSFFTSNLDQGFIF